MPRASSPQSPLLPALQPSRPATPLPAVQASQDNRPQPADALDPHLAAGRALHRGRRRPARSAAAAIPRRLGPFAAPVRPAAAPPCGYSVTYSRNSTATNENQHSRRATTPPQHIRCRRSAAGCQPARQAVQSQQPTFDSGNSSSSVRAPYIRPQARLPSSTRTVEEASPPTSYQRRWFRCGSGARPPLLSRVSVPHVLHQHSPSTVPVRDLVSSYLIGTT